MNYMTMKMLAVTCVMCLATSAMAAEKARPGFAAGNSKAPIEINADALEVQQEKKYSCFHRPCGGHSG